MTAYFDSKYYSELQRVKSFNSNVIRKMTKDIDLLKKDVKEYYEGADPSTKTGQVYFELLNKTRDRFKYLKIALKSMEIQQRLVKKEMRMVVMNYHLNKEFVNSDGTV